METALIVMAQNAAGAAGFGGATPPTGADATDAARFAQLMSVAPAGGVDATPSLGDAILDRLGAIGSDYSHSLEAFQRSVAAVNGEGRDLGPAQLLQAMHHTTELSLRVSLIADLAQKATQGVNELTKLQ